MNGTTAASRIAFGIRPRRASGGSELLRTGICLRRTRARQLQLGLWISRVPSKENISDDPSRERYDLLAKLGASWVAPRLDAFFASSQSWESLSVSVRSLVGAAASAA